MFSWYTMPLYRKMEKIIISEVRIRTSSPSSSSPFFIGNIIADSKDRSTLDIDTPVLYVNHPGWRSGNSVAGARGPTGGRLPGSRSSEDGRYIVSLTRKRNCTRCMQQAKSGLLHAATLVSSQSESSQAWDGPASRVNLPFAGFVRCERLTRLCHTHPSTVTFISCREQAGNLSTMGDCATVSL
jgi:hypothetical protein